MTRVFGDSEGVSMEPSASASGSSVQPILGEGGNGSLYINDGDQFSRALLAEMLAFKQGNFSVRMPNDLTGVNGKIADAFNDIALVSERRAHETARVTRAVGKEGKLKQRMTLAGLSGGWADEVAALNTLIDDLVWPTTEVTAPSGA